MRLVDSAMNKSFYGVLSQTVKVEGLKIFYKGFIPFILQGLPMVPLFILSTLKETRGENHKLYAFPSALAGLLFSHPLNVIAVKLWSLHHSQVEREAYRNTMRAILYTAKTEGLLGFYRGFVPMTIIKAAIYHKDILDAFNAFIGKQVIIKE